MSNPAGAATDSPVQPPLTNTWVAPSPTNGLTAMVRRIAVPAVITRALTNITQQGGESEESCQKTARVCDSALAKPVKKIPFEKSFRLASVDPEMVIRFRTPTLVELQEKAAFHTYGVPLKDSIAIAGQVLQGLCALSKVGRIHREVHAENIAYDIAKKKAILLGGARSTSRYDEACFYQTRSIRSPEDILGHPADARIDVWSLGVTLYGCYAGSPLFPLPPWTSDEQENIDLLHSMLAKIGRPSMQFVRQGGEWQEYCKIDSKGQVDLLYAPSNAIQRYLTPYIKMPTLTDDLFMTVAKGNKEDLRLAGKFYEFLMTLVSYQRPTAEEALAIWKRLFDHKLQVFGGKRTLRS